LNKWVSIGKKLSIHPLFWLVMCLAIVTGHFVSLLILFIIVFVHELGHAFAALFFSWRIKKISLLPFGGVAEVDEHGNRSELEEFILIIAGPLQHVWMLAAGFILFRLGWMSPYLYSEWMTFNYMVLFFNLLPIWPLDGGKLLLLGLSRFLSFQQAYQAILTWSLASLLLFHSCMLWLSPYHLNLWIIFSFLYFSIWMEWKKRHYTFMRFLMDRYYGKASTIKKLKTIYVQADEKLFSVLEKFQRGYKHPIVVVKNGKEIGSLDENEVLHAFFSYNMFSARIDELLYAY
jgi:stage IV sporulation protein FB